MKNQKLSFGRKACLLAIPLVGVGLIVVALMLRSASAIATNDGLLFYGANSNTNPQVRAYNSGSFGSAGGTVSGAQALATTIKTSPTKYEAIAGYVNSSGVLQIMCYDGVSWSNEWTVTVGGTGTTKPFDIAYENTSGKVIVLYGNNGASLGYRTKLASSGCGSANWVSASTFTPARTTGTVSWVKLASDRRASSNLIAAAWADNSSDLSAQIWSGSGWGTEPGAALATTLEFVTAAQDTDNFDLEYESSSGDLMVVWGIAGTTGTTNLIKYAACTGGTSGCTWGSVTSVTTVADSATDIDISSNPINDQIALAAVDKGGGANSCDMSGALWGGTSWQGLSNVDATVECPTAGQQTVSTFFMNNGGTSRWVLVYDDSAGNGIQWKTYNGITVTAQTTSASPTGDIRNRFAVDVNPFNQSEAIVTLVDGSSALYAKKLTMDSSGVFSTWSNVDGGSSLGTVAQAAVGDFSYAYWRYIPTLTYVQSAYRWYANADSTTPGSALSNENTAHTLTSLASPLRLRTQLDIGGNNVDVTSQAVKLQYATVTSGPWKDVGPVDLDTWCNDTTGVTCTTSWGARRKITMNNSASTENLGNFPLLVKVNASRIDYGKTQSAGQDIRFVDSSDPNTVLPYEIESWNESGDSYIWVKVPQVDSGSSTDYLWMYYDNASASDGQSATNVWDSGYKVVQHLKETSACPVTFADSTSTGNNGACTGGGPSASSGGKVDGARDFDGSDDYINIADSPTQDLTNGTYEAWANIDATGSYRFLIEKGEEDDDNYSMFINNSNRLAFFYRDTGFSGHTITDTTTTVSAGTWYRCVVVFDDTNNAVKFYINGVQVLSQTDTNTPMVTTSGGIHLGTEIFGGSASSSMDGKMDEVRISNIARSGDWLKADYLSQNDTMNTFGSEQDQGSLTPSAWDFYNNATPVNGATLGSSLLTGTDVLETYQDSNPPALNPNAINPGQQAEWDFSLDPANAANATTYYFRIIKSDGSAIDSYTYYPELIINVSTGSTLDQQMRGGQSVVNGVKQPFNF